MEILKNETQSAPMEFSTSGIFHWFNPVEALRRLIPTLRFYSQHCNEIGSNRIIHCYAEA